MNHTLATWNPFRELNELSNRLSFLAGHGNHSRGVAGDWTPQVDIREDADGYCIHADLPRVDKDNVTVTFADRVLTIEGQRETEAKREGATMHLVERSCGRFVRSFRLPEDADGEAVKATFKEGVLTVFVPKREESKPKTIEIRVD